MREVKFISDLHLYDISSYDWRGDARDLDEFAKFLVESWNAFTDPNDIILLVGDIGLFCSKTIDILKSLNGRKILIMGNHDVVWGSNVYSCGAFVGVHDSVELNGIHVQHIPEEYHGSCKFYVHGHHHRYDMPGMQNKLQQYARDTCRLNCAVDINNYRPCSLQELILNKEVLLDKYSSMGLL